MKYIKKPEVFEAIQWDGNLSDLTKLKKFVPVKYRHNKVGERIGVLTQSGPSIIYAGCWIVKNKKNIFSVYTPAQFKKMYEGYKSITIKQALERLIQAMKEDPDYAHGWQSNIAMPIWDNSNDKLNFNEASDIADALMRHLFQIKK